jgi:hypothetical protein
MHATPISPPDNIRALLPGADFTDAYQLIIEEPGLEAPAAAQRVLQRPPAWTAMLLKVRNILVTPFGLKTGPAPGAAQTIGWFPLLTSTPERVVFGLDDRHLDFRIAVDVLPLDEKRTRLVVSTAVKTHNIGGRLYLATIKPFHRAIVPAMLGRAQRR